MPMRHTAPTLTHGAGPAVGHEPTSLFPSSHIVPIRVLAAVIRNGDRYLICRRPDHKRHGGLWEFPGGKIEAGETDLEAAIREMREELDVEVSAVGAPVFIRQDEGSDFSIEFMPVNIAGKPRAIEHSAIAWARAEEVVEYDLAPSDRLFAEGHLLGQSASCEP